MLDYNQLKALYEVVEQGQFVLAAKKLAVTQPALSQKIKLLEDLVGSPLIIRSNPIRATKVGNELIQHFKKVQFLENQTLKTLLNQHEEKQRIAIALNTESLSTWFLKCITSSIQQKHYLLDIQIDDQDITHELLRNGQVLAAVSSKKTPPNGCRSMEVGTMEYTLVATPFFKDTHFKKNISLNSIKLAPAIAYGKDDKILDELLMRHFKKQALPELPYHYVPSPQGIIDFTLMGLGYSLVPKISILDHLKSKSLIQIDKRLKHSVKLHLHYWSQAESSLHDFFREISMLKLN